MRTRTGRAKPVQKKTAQNFNIDGLLLDPAHVTSKVLPLALLAWANRAHDAPDGALGPDGLKVATELRERTIEALKVQNRWGEAGDFDQALLAACKVDEFVARAGRHSISLAFGELFADLMRSANSPKVKGS